MALWQYGLISLSFFFFYSVIYKLTKKKKPFKRAFLTMLSGVLILLIVDISGIYTGVTLPISAFSVTVSACAGIPGIASMLIIANLL